MIFPPVVTTRTSWFPLPIAAAWAAFGVAQGLIRNAANLSASTVLEALAFDVPLALLWGAFTPIIGRWDAAVGRRARPLWARVAAHAPLVITLALTYTLARRVLVLALGGTVNVPFHVTLLYFLDVTVASYLAAAWVARTLDAERARAARERRSNALRAQLAAAQMQFLDLQLRPHFLFNALGAISELAHEAPRNAARMLRNVVQLLDTGAARQERALTTLGEELESLRPYLEIQRLRFTDWLTIEEHADPDSRRALVPQFILQPLVENAVHHGLKGRTRRGHIALNARRVGERLVIEVVDNGVGLSRDAYQQRRGLGLDNVRARLAAVYGADAGLSLLDRQHDGAAARLDVPYHVEPPAELVAGEVGDAQPPAERHAEPRYSRLQGSRLAAALVIGWSIVAFFRVQHSVAYLWLRDALSPEALRSALWFDVAVTTLWLLVTPVVFLIFSRIPLRRQALWARAAAHVALSVGIALAHASLTPLVLSGFDTTRWSGPVRELFAWNVAIYAILLVLWHLRDVRRWTERRNAEDLRLWSDLEAARFRRLVLELRPNALLAALEGLVARVADDARGAEIVLADIGDFLRSTLDVMCESHVTLRDEASAAHAYARVLAAGAEPALTLRIAIPLELMEVAVPNGVLRAMLDCVAAAPADAGTVVVTVAAEQDAVVVDARREASLQVPAARTDAPVERLRAYEQLGFLELVRHPQGVRVRILAPPASSGDATERFKRPLAHAAASGDI